MSLRQNFLDAVEGYMKAFCKKHDVTVDHWPGGAIGETCCFSNDTYVGFDEIRFDIDHDLPKGMIWEWCDEMLEAHYKNLHMVSLENWSKGLRPSPRVKAPTQQIQKEDTEAIIEKALTANMHIDNAIGNTMSAGLSDSEAMKVVFDSMPAIDAGLSVAVGLHSALRTIKNDIQEHLDHEHPDH